MSIRYTIKLSQSTFGITPIGFNTIDMTGRIGDFILAMLNTIMFVVANNYQTVKAPPTIAVNHTIRVHLTAYDTLERLFSGIRDNLCVDFPMPFEHAKRNGFTGGISPAFNGDPTWSEVRFIDFNGSMEPDRLIGPPGDMITQFVKDNCNRPQGNTG